MLICHECGEGLARCHMGCREMRCPNDCEGDELEHERAHAADEERQYDDRLRDLDEEFGRR